MDPQQNIGTIASTIDQNTIVACFQYIHNPNATPAQRKQANSVIIESQKYLVSLIKILVAIFKNQNKKYDPHIRMQALLYLSNVVKRNWNNKALAKKNDQFIQIKKFLPSQIMMFLQSNEKMYVKSLFDLIKFLAKSDYPHGFPQLTNFTLAILDDMKVTKQHVAYLKELREIFLQLAQRKGFTNAKNYQEGPRKILNALCQTSEGLRHQICQKQSQNNHLIRYSKYCDQMIISLLRIAPYQYLDDESFMMIPKHICEKLQNLLTIHCSQNQQSKQILQKDIKSIVYQLGCLQVVNPCCLAIILSDYISTLFYIISKPEVFTKPQTIKYALLSMRKIVKQFTYYSDDAIFTKSISSNPKSNNYIQLRNIAHQAYNEFMTQDTIQGLFNFLLTNIMSIKSKQDERFSISFDQSGTTTSGYEKSMQKDLTVHACGTLLTQSLIQRFTQKMLQLIYSLTNNCIQNNWATIDNSTIANFLSIISVLPQSCKRSQLNQLTKFPIIDVLQFAHGSSFVKIRQKFPILICGWIDIFTNEQIGQLNEALVSYIVEGSESNNMDLALYSCYSLNKILNLRSAAVDSGAVLYKVFPTAIKIFGQTDNPQILWPLINLISNLLTKCQFDSNIIVHAIQTQSLQLLITNQSEMLVEALCQMFKSFLCIIPRNMPATGVYTLIYHFLNTHLAKTSAQYHEKCINLWYYALRQFSFINLCSNQYKQLFDHHFKKCAHIKKPIIVYILQEYILLGIIEENMEWILSYLSSMYMESGDLQFKDQFCSEQYQQNKPKISEMEDTYSLKIAILSFYITLLTKYNFQKVNSKFLLQHILEDLGSIRDEQNLPSNIKGFINTLRNSNVSVLNRYILLNPDYFFSYLENEQIPVQLFYSSYIASSAYLTSRGAMRINALALLTILPRTIDQLKAINKQSFTTFLVKVIKQIIPQIENYAKLVLGQQGPNAGKIENSPTYRFSQSILSQRKQQIRKQGSYESFDIRQYFVKQLGQFLGKAGIGLQQFAEMIQSHQQGNSLGVKLMQMCR